MSILDLIRTDNYLILNRTLIQALGLHPAVILCELANQSAWFEEKEKTECFDGEDGYFYEVMKDLEKRTGLSRKEQDSAIKILKDKNLIKTAIKGMPAKRYFKINEEMVYHLFSKRHSSLSKRDNLECPKQTTYFVQKGQSAQYIQENKRENKVRDSSPKKNILLVSYGKHVKLTQEDYDSFCTKHSKGFIDDLIERMNDYCGANGKVYKCYASALRGWIRKEPPKPEGNKTPKEIAKAMKEKYFIPPSCEWEDTGTKVMISKVQGATQWVMETPYSAKYFAQDLESMIIKAGGCKRG